MADSKEEVLIDNDLVKVVRVNVGAGATHQAPGRGPRVVISLSDEEETRTEHQRDGEHIRRRVGDAVFREASSGHTIENSAGAPHTVLIVELKKPGR
jgi:hypothetical protein